MSTLLSKDFYFNKRVPTTVFSDCLEFASLVVRLRFRVTTKGVCYVLYRIYFQVHL